MKSHFILWTEPMDDLLKRLIDAKYSANSASKEMILQLGKGVSRKACIGRAYRLGLRFHSDREVTHAKVYTRPSKQRSRARIAAHAKPRDDVVATPSEPVALGPFNDFPLSGCKWIHGDPLKGQWRCCAASTHDGHSYCAHHDHRASKELTPHQQRFVKPNFTVPGWAA
jgi:hypothetical protein